MSAPRHVWYRGQSGRQMLNVSSSGFDPQPTSASLPKRARTDFEIADAERERAGYPTCRTDTGHAINPAHCAGPRVWAATLARASSARAYDHTVMYYIYYLQLNNTATIR